MAIHFNCSSSTSQLELETLVLSNASPKESASQHFPFSIAVKHSQSVGTFCLLLIYFFLFVSIPHCALAEITWIKKRKKKTGKNSDDVDKSVRSWFLWIAWTRDIKKNTYIEGKASESGTDVRTGNRREFDARRFRIGKIYQGEAVKGFVVFKCDQWQVKQPSGERNRDTETSNTSYYHFICATEGAGPTWDEDMRSPSGNPPVLQRIPLLFLSEQFRVIELILSWYFHCM